MIINDKMFGELEYDEDFWAWEKKEKEKYTFFGKVFESDLYIDASIDDYIDFVEVDGVYEPVDNGLEKSIEETKREAYTQYKKNEKELISQMEDAIYNHYQGICEELRELYEENAEEWAPIISKKEELANLITLDYVIISRNSEDDREINFIFDAVWDMEGIGIRLINEKIAIVGYQDGVL